MTNDVCERCASASFMHAKFAERILFDLPCERWAVLNVNKLITKISPSTFKHLNSSELISLRFILKLF